MSDPPVERVTRIPRLPPREPETHKAQVGRILVLAGSRGMSGAAVLAARGALRGGAGLVRVLTPASVQPVVAASEPCLMSVPLPEDDHGRAAADALETVRASFDWGDVLAIGPGLGCDAGVAQLVREVLAAWDKPAVIDADAINNLATLGADVLTQLGSPETGGGQPPSAGDAKHGGQPPSAGDAKHGGQPPSAGDGGQSPPTVRPRWVFTPHPGEARRLADALKLDIRPTGDDETRTRAAAALARSLAAVVVLKGRRTVVCDGDRAYINTSGNPGMATGGMGDVLTGLIAALIGQKLPPFDAAVLAVHVHGLAADVAARQIGPVGYLARDVAELLPCALRDAGGSQIGFHGAR